MCGEECCNKKHRAKTERFQNRYLIRLLQLSAAGEVFLEGTCPLSRCPQTAKFPAPSLLGARRRWVRKATAFRGRSEQDRSALCAGCCAVILKTFRWSVFNDFFFAAKTSDTARRVPTNIYQEPPASCAQLDQPFRGNGCGIVLFLPDAFPNKKGHGAPCPFSASNPAKRKNARKLMLPSI